MKAEETELQENETLQQEEGGQGEEGQDPNEAQPLETVEKPAPPADLKASLLKYRNWLSSLRKTTFSQDFEHSQYGIVKEWISTGDYGLNRVISGSMFKGVPSGRVVLVGGESQSGKSYMAACVTSTALEMGYDHVFYFDSEGGALRSFFENRGCDVSKIEHVLVENVEDAEVKILAVYKKIEEIKKSFPGMRFLCIYDSLGASVAKKVFNDAANGKVVSDMGSRARLVNNMMKALIIPALKTDTTIIVINHVYDNPASLFTQKIQNQGGGKAVQYLARITLQCTKKYEKSGGENGYYKATVLKFFSVKNSIVKPFFDTEMYLDFSKGPNPYYGIIRPAIESGFLVPQKGGVRVPLCNNAFFTMPALLDPSKSKQMWDVVLPELDKVFSEKMSYSGPPSDEEELLEEAKAAADSESESIAATLELPGEGSPETPEQAEEAQAEKP